MGKFSGLIDKMTTAEKLAQMTQIMGDCFLSEGYGKLMGISYGFDIPPELAWNVGSVLGMGGAEKLKALQARYLEQNRHRIPLLFMNDVIHGYRTIFPSPLGLASAWDPELMERTCAVAAREAAVSGVHVTFSPMADLAQDGRWGRVVEGVGEDPLLNSQYAAAAVRGYQGCDLGRYRIASCVKHFAGYGAAEAGRDYNTTQISQYDLQERFLPAYKAAVDAGCRLVMTAFNALNGVPCTGDEKLFRELLRGQWGFGGTVISDCTAVCELVPHGFCEDDAQAAEAAIKAGVDIEMVSTTYFNRVEKLIATGRLDARLLDEAVGRILDLKDELGLFDDPYRDASEEGEAAWHLCPEHRALARLSAARSAVLLKNENDVLPLKPHEKIALIGPYADSNLLLDIWKCEGREEECVTLREGLKDRADCAVARGCDILDEDDSGFEEAERVAAACDKVVLCLGEHPEMSAEAGSRAHLTLPEIQVKLAERIFSLGKPVAVVLFHGRPLELGSIADGASALLLAWFPGTEGGSGIADVLLGATPPSGRLTMSFPHTVGQLPLYYNALPTGRPTQGANDTERFRSRYLDAPAGPLFPFGFGLTYTRFTYSAVELSADSMTGADTITAAVTLTNAGSLPGTETVQLYLRDLAGSYARPVRMLKDYRRVWLAPGQSCRAEFAITAETLKYHTREHGYAAEPGGFLVFIGPDSLSDNCAAFRLV